MPTPGTASHQEYNAALVAQLRPELQPGLRVIKEYRLAAPAASVTFANIPQYYRTLKLTLDARSDRAGQELDVVGLRFNGDAGAANYDWMRYSAQFGGAVVPAGARATSNINIAWIEAVNSTANTYSPCTITMVDYALADRYKRAYCESSGVFGNLSADTDLYMSHHRGQRRNTAATASLTLFLTSASNFVATSIFTLSGVL